MTNELHVFTHAPPFFTRKFTLHNPISSPFPLHKFNTASFMDSFSWFSFFYFHLLTTWFQQRHLWISILFAQVVRVSSNRTLANSILLSCWTLPALVLFFIALFLYLLLLNSGFPTGPHPYLHWLAPLRYLLLIQDSQERWVSLSSISSFSQLRRALNSFIF